MTNKSVNYNEIFSDNQKPSNFSPVILVLLFSILFGLFGYYIGDRGLLKNINPFSSKTEENAAQATTYTASQIKDKVNLSAYDMDLYYQIIANLKDKYIDLDKVKDETLFDGSLKGLVDSVGDKATSYMNPKDYKDYQASFSGTFEGIGVRLDYLSGAVGVVDVFKNSPAAAAGVKTGYIFYKVDGVDVSGSNTEDVVNKVRGKAGTKVKIVFVDSSTKEEVTKEITRAPVKVDSMRLVEKSPDTVSFEITRFTEDSVEEWADMWDENVDKIVSKGYKNVILDLRGNGGGYLDAAIYAANDFLDPGKLVLSEKSRIRKEKDNLTTNKNPRLKDKKVIILINGGTASASEILAGALKHHKNYKIIGVKSYGKGTVQNTYILGNGGALKVTTEYWLLPNGKKLDNENPILPDQEIKQDQDGLKTGKDNVMDEALKQF